MVDDCRDLETLLGEPKKAIRSMVMAFFMALAVVQVNQFADTFWVSGLGAGPSAAVATVIPIYFLITCAGLGIGVGTTATIAFRLGRGEREEANRLAANAMMLGIACGIVSSALLAVFAKPLIDLIGAGSLMDDCLGYLTPYVLFSPLVICNTILGGALSGEGASRKSASVQISAAAFNIVLDPIFIYGLGLGVFGAGLATVSAAGLSILVGLSWYAKGQTAVSMGRGSFVRDGGMAREILDIGGPRTVQAVFSGMTNVVQRVFLIFAGGTNAVLFYNYPWRFIEMFTLPGKAFESAMVPVCSSAHGQGDFGKVRESYAYTAKMALLFGVLASVFLYVFSEQLMAILTYEETMEALRPQFVWTMRVSTVLVPFTALMGVGSSMLQALKKARASMYFFFLWGLAKLGMYAFSAYVLHSFEWIIYSMVIVHVSGGLCMTCLAHREFRRASRAASKGAAEAAS